MKHRSTIRGWGIGDHGLVLEVSRHYDTGLIDRIVLAREVQDETHLGTHIEELCVMSQEEWSEVTEVMQRECWVMTQEDIDELAKLRKEQGDE